MANFEPCFQRTLNFEGRELETVPNDPGGETYYGISRKWNPFWDGWKLIDQNPSNITLPDLAKDFYLTVYWNRNKLGSLDSQELAAQVFDAVVNLGDDPIKALQALAGVVTDGIMGVESVYACNVQDEDKLVAGFIGWRKLFYANLVEKDPSKKEFLNGWLARCKLTTEA